MYKTTAKKTLFRLAGLALAVFAVAHSGSAGAKERVDDPAVTTSDERYQIMSGTNKFDSTGQLIGDPFLGGLWGNADNGSAFILRKLGGEYTLKEIQIETAGSDVSTDGAEINVQVKRASDGKWMTVAYYAEVAINRAFNFSEPEKTVIGPQRIQFEPVAATQVRIKMKGHGWFFAGDIRIFGTGS